MVDSVVVRTDDVAVRSRLKPQRHFGRKRRLRVAIDVELSIEDPRQLLDDPQSEAGSAVGRRVADVEHRLAVRGRNPRTVVRDIESVLQFPEGYPGSAVFDRVALDVLQKLFEPVSIGPELPIHFDGEVHLFGVDVSPTARTDL